MNSEYLKDLYDKLKKDKKSFIILIIALSGIFLIFISGLTAEDENGSKYVSEESFVMSENELSETLEKLIESIDGAGKAKVMLTFKSYNETVYAVNTEENINSDGERDYTGEYIIIDSSDGEDGLKLKITAPEIRGVAVICHGGNNPVIKEQIVSVVSALFDISSNKISVAAMAK